MEVHLLHEDGEGLGGVLASGVGVVHIDPLAEEALSLLEEAGRIIELPRLLEVVLNPLRGHLDHVH